MGRLVSLFIKLKLGRVGMGRVLHLGPTFVSMGRMVLGRVVLHPKVLCPYRHSCRTATLDFFFDLAESKVTMFLCSILTSDGVPFCFGKNLFP